MTSERQPDLFEGDGEPAHGGDAREPGAAQPADGDQGAGDEDGDGAFRLSLDVFEGPLDLLLHLIERNELDVTEVSLLEVSDQYLRHLRAADVPDIARLAEFISVGARLLLLKSRALLPREDQDQAPDDDEGDDVGALIEALREYRRFKQAAEFLRERDGGHASYRREAAPPEVPMPTGLDTVTLNSLVDVIRDVLARLPEEEEVREVEREPIRLRDRMVSLIDALERDGRASFRRLIEAATSRTMIIVDFMAVLELIKQSYLEARQSESFGDIDLVRREGAQPPEMAAIESELEEDFSGA